MYADVWLSAPDPGPDRCLWLPQSLLDEWELPLGGQVVLSYGLRSTEAQIGIVGASSHKGRRRFVVPSVALAQELNLVTDLEYRLARSGPASIVLGPIIGLIVDARGQRGGVSDREWERLMQAYGEVKGLTILLGPDDVDWNSGFVNGRYYNPNHEAGPWISGRFPIPAAVHRRTTLTAKAENEWLQWTDRRVFNGRCSVDRWDVHQAVARHADLAPRLAPVSLASSFHAVREALDRSQRIWLKPRSDDQGRGVVLLELTGTGVEATYLSQGKDVRRRFRTNKELRAFLGRPYMLGGRYIVQEPVPSATIGGRPFDVRFLIQRGGTGEFCCHGKFAKLIPPGSVSAAPEHGAILLPVDLALTAALKIELDQAREVEQRAVAWCCDLLGRLEEDFQTLGDVGVDVAIGPDGEFWLIECDFCPDYSVFEAFDADMYRSGSTMWHRFASFLARFPVPT